MTQATDEQASDFPVQLGMPVRNALFRIGVYSLAQVATMSEADLKELHGVGSKGIEQLRVALTAKGLAYATSNFTVNLAAPARRALINAGIRRLEQVAEYSEADLMQLHGMGPKALDQLATALAEKGLAFAAATGRGS